MITYIIHLKIAYIILELPIASHDYLSHLTIAIISSHGYKYLSYLKCCSFLNQYHWGAGGGNARSKIN